MKRVAGLLLVVAALGAGCSSGGAPKVAAAVEGISIPSSETEALLNSLFSSPRRPIENCPENSDRGAIVARALQESM